MFQQLYTICRNTFTESIRQPVFLVLILVGLLAIVLNPFVSAYSMYTDLQQGDTKILIDLGFSTLFIIGLLLAAFTATNVLNKEIENKTVLTVISKPVARPLFVLGKFIGVSGAIALGFFLLSIVFLFTVRHGVKAAAYNQLDTVVIGFALAAGFLALIVATLGNYFYRWIFTSSLVWALVIAETLAFICVMFISKKWEFQSPFAEFIANDYQMFQVLLGLIMVFEAVLIITAIALACSTRLGQIMTLVICIGVFLIGLISNALGQMVNKHLSLPTQADMSTSLHAIFVSDATFASKIAFVLGKLVYILAPNLQFLWPADAITQGHSFSAGILATVTGYAACYIIAILALAVALFQTRETG